MSTTSIERPIELDVLAVDRLLTGPRRAVLTLPMRPTLMMTPAIREALLGGMLELGICADGLTDAELVDSAFREGLEPTWRCPWGVGGDVLWVRERWAQVGRGYRYFPFDRPARGDDWLWHEPQRMPRDAARLVLRICRVAVEQDAAGALVWWLEVEVCR